MTQQPGGPYQPPPHGYQPPLNTYALLALLLCLLVFPPLGIILGNMAKKQIAQTGERGIELANIAVILGWIFSALLVGFLVLWCAMFGAMFALPFMELAGP